MIALSHPGLLVLRRPFDPKAKRFATAITVDEVRRLRARGDLHAELPSMRCVGYRQAWELLDRGDPPDLVALHQTAVAATRQLAKRQLTWLRAMPWRHVVPADAPDAPAQVVALAQRLLDQAPA